MRPRTGTLTFCEHGGRFARVDERDLLRRRDDDRAGERDGLHDGELDVAGAGREIEHEEIEVAPLDLPEKLLGVFRDHRPAQDGGRGVVEQEAHRHELQVVALDGDDAVVRRWPSGVRCVPNIRPMRRAVKIAVAEADGRAGSSARRRRDSRRRSICRRRPCRSRRR